MARQSNEYLARYDELKTESCNFCGSDNGLMPMYHPKSLLPEERGVKIRCCTACYGSYKAKGLDNMPLAFVTKALVNRTRHQSKNTQTFSRFNLGLTKYLDDCNKITCAEDENGIRYDPEDVQLYEDSISLFITMTPNQIEKWCKDNLTDQKFINKVVSSFSS